MTKKQQKLHSLLEAEVAKRNTQVELSYDRPDPLLVASRYKDERVALICALFGYGNAGQIVKFLDSLDFDLLNQDEDSIKDRLKNHYYRFQKSDDVSALFIALKRLSQANSIENIFYEGYQKDENILDGLWNFIDKLSQVYPHHSQGYRFLIGSIPPKINTAGTYKRYMMFLRWMIRNDHLDMGLWSKINKRDLIIPLDTHTFKVSQKLGLLQRKSYDLKAALELTASLKEFDLEDPVKYDFALYRIGQEKRL